MGKFARDKGQRGEREVKDAFIDAMAAVEAALAVDRPDMAFDKHSEAVKRNTLQADRGGDDLAGVPMLSIEIKRQETLSLNAWWQQCLRQCGHNMPTLIYRQTRQPWRVVTYALLTIPDNHATRYTQCTMLFDDFMLWYMQAYRAWLMTTHR